MFHVGQSGHKRQNAHEDQNGMRAELLKMARMAKRDTVVMRAKPVIRS